jgi:3-isopropylmalate dehydrogenase
MSKAHRIAIVPGDGIGPEVLAECTKLLRLLKKHNHINVEWDEKDWGADRWLREKVGLPAGAMDDLKDNYDAILFGALGDPRIPDMAHGREILLGMRFGLDLYVNMRPVQVLKSELCPVKNIGDGEVDMVIFRENTEDMYVSMGGNFKEGTDDEVAIDQSMNTRKGVERIIRHAFQFAKSTGRKKVTMVDKSNAIRFGGGLWKRVCAEVAAQYPTIESDHLFVDVAAMEMVRNPKRFDVVVTNNLFGDILSDIGAGLSGSLGLAASGNIHPDRIGLFEPVHGSAPDIVGTGKANPIAAFLSTGMLLHFLGYSAASDAISDTAKLMLSLGKTTPELGGNLSTIDAGSAFRDSTLGSLQ